MGITSVSRTDHSAAFNVEVAISEDAWRQLADYRVEDDSTKVSLWKKALSWLASVAVSHRSRARAQAR